MSRSTQAAGRPHQPHPMAAVYTAACAYRAVGLSLIPIAADGRKMPAFSLLPAVWSEEMGRNVRPWKPYTRQPPTPEELQFWFADPRDRRTFGLAVLGGQVSGGLEIIDCDNAAVAEEWSEIVRREHPALFTRLVRVRSPRPGLHAYFRSAACEGSQKLARGPDPETMGVSPKTLIETKGEGGYCLAPPSPGACHPSGRPYVFEGDIDLTRVPTISVEERELLLDAARRLNRWEQPARQRPAAPTRPAGAGRPGDDFNDRADWADILTPHKWSWLRSGGGGEDLWCRPGKSGETSATTDHGGSDRLYVFSTNADPFEAETSYDKFSAYALLNHGGNFHAAAADLAHQGYGRRVNRYSSGPLARYAKFTSRSLEKRT